MTRSAAVPPVWPVKKSVYSKIRPADISCVAKSRVSTPTESAAAGCAGAVATAGSDGATAKHDATMPTSRRLKFIPLLLLSGRGRLPRRPAYAESTEIAISGELRFWHRKEPLVLV